MLPLFIVDQIPDRGEVVIEGDEAHHASSVVRIKVGERILVTNGYGRRAEVEVSDINKRNIAARIIDLHDIPRPQTTLTVIQALTKGDRARETIELLTEGGATTIVPWAASRSVGQWKEEKDSLAKWRSWAREATKQSRRSWIPEVTDVRSTSQIKEMLVGHPAAFLFHEGGEEKISRHLAIKPPTDVVIIIGPEGGVSKEEASAFVGAGAKVVVMGGPVFRSAHAGVAALAAIQTGLGIW